MITYTNLFFEDALSDKLELQKRKLLGIPTFPLGVGVGAAGALALKKYFDKKYFDDTHKTPIYLFADKLQQAVDNQDPAIQQNIYKGMSNAADIINPDLRIPVESLRDNINI